MNLTGGVSASIMCGANLNFGGVLNDYKKYGCYKNPQRDTSSFSDVTIQENARVTLS